VCACNGARPLYLEPNMFGAVTCKINAISDSVQ
jgi:hypothetical protein